MTTTQLKIREQLETQAEETIASLSSMYGTEVADWRAVTAQIISDQLRQSSEFIAERVREDDKGFNDTPVSVTETSRHSGLLRSSLIALMQEAEQFPRVDR